KRLAVKMEFLTDDLVALANPTAEQLQTFLHEHPDKFNVEALTSFAQVYINRSQRGEGAAAEAEHVLVLLNDNAGSDWQTLGDPLPLPGEYEAATEADVARLFGREFPRKLAGLRGGRGGGRGEAGGGLPLVVGGGGPGGGAPPLDEVHDAVVSEWRAAQRLELNENLRRQRRARYAVTVEWPDWAKE